VEWGALLRSPRAVTVVSDPRSSRNQAMTDASRAAVELFIDSGRTDFTVTELARHVRISERSFYRYFPRKEDVVRPFLTGGFERISALVAARPADEPVRTTLVAAWSGSWVSTDTDRSRRLFRLLFDDDGLRATWFKVITESEAGWARVIALRIGIDPNSQRAALIGAVVVAAARLSTKSFVDSGTDVDPARIFAANLELLGDELFAGPSPTTIKKAGTRS
jgi:AcrR family transcriptional regulator